ncbi:hypothetical protein EGT67_12810 [Prescottella agglutinans]|uniref:Uncharacterized protein n=1 Tax=Prescottella agglutinans TaxID=1644129 RepID=A0A3S3E9T3_9NOCA|nr:hypothetical protein [Prescottella agglutinans]RVW09036.1 hypothetical protein EGT67_12810 [Prescottella agglutinans]
MSWFVYVVRFSDGRDATMDRAAVEKVLGKYRVQGVLDSEDACLFFESGCCTDVSVGLADDGRSIASLGFVRPSGDQVWDVIHEILQATGAVLIDPDGEIVVASADALVGLPVPFDEYPYTIAGSGDEMPWR